VALVTFPERGKNITTRTAITATAMAMETYSTKCMIGRSSVRCVVATAAWQEHHDTKYGDGNGDGDEKVFWCVHGGSSRGNETKSL
jgi:hypothetical protein